MVNLRSLLPRLAALGFLALSAVPSFAQAPPPVPALPDQERRTSYSLSGTTCACSVGFALFGSGSDVDQWIEVWVAGVRYLSTDASHGWALTSATGSVATIPRPISDAVLTFTAVQTGTVQIVGAERPRRAAQFAENRGVPARDLNQAITDLLAVERELWDKTNDVTGRSIMAPPGENLNVLSPAASRANTTLGFNLSGQLALFPPGSGGNCPPLFTAVAAGCVPASGGGTANYLRADGTWAPPSAIQLSPPQGRLTLISNNPAPISSQAGATTIYYTPAVGSFIPTTVDGVTFQMTSFAQVSQTTADTAKSPAGVIANANYDLFGWLDGGTFRVTRGDYWKTASQTITVTIASPAVLTCGTCTFNTNFNPPLVLATTGALPTGLVAGTTYWITPLTATTANISATAGGSNINTSGSQSGTQSGIFGDDTGASYRSGATSLTAVAGLLLNTSSVTNGPAALRGTYVGTARSDAAATFNMTFGGISAGGSPALLNVFNQYNQVPTVAIVGDSTASWSYTTAAFRPMDNSTGNRVSFLAGTQTNPIDVMRGGYVITAAILNTFALNGYSLDKITGLADRAVINQSQAANALTTSSSAVGKYAPQLGAHFVQAVEIADGTNAATFEGSAQAQYLQVETLQ